MSCISLIAKPVTSADIAGWNLASQIVGKIQTLPVINLDIQNGQYTFDKVCFDLIDCNAIAGIVWHECNDLPTDEIIADLTIIGNDTFTIEDGKLCFVPCSWTVPNDACADEIDDPIIDLPSICENPCERNQILENLIAQFMANKQVASTSWNNRSMSFRYSNEIFKKLCQWQRDAQQQCDCLKGVRSGPPRNIIWRCW